MSERVAVRVGARWVATMAVAAAAVLVTADAGAQQVGDSTYVPRVERPTFALGTGPRVLVDEGHHNFHTADGRFRTFAELLRRDGWRVASLAGPVTAAALADARVLVIANALAERNVGDWSLPTPSAFTPAETDALDAWVRAGGSLLLIADHMPFPGAAEALASRFGFELRNGFAMLPARPGPLVFRTSDGSLRADPLGGDHPAAAGGPWPAPDSVASFTGQAFRAVAPGVEPILVLPRDVVSLEPDTAWAFHEGTARVPVGGWLQAAARRHGAGRVAVFGEAAMFTAQWSGPQRAPMGMNHPAAEQNHLLVLGVMRWLAGGGGRP